MDCTRRFFLKSTGALMAYCGVAPTPLLAKEAMAEVARGKTLVVIFLRGGMDGLNFIVPFGDPAYYELRKAIAIKAPGQNEGALDLDGHFALHPRAAALHPLFEQGLAAALQAVGYDKNTRSHFEEQDTWETGIIGNTVQSDGWLNRHLRTSEGHGPIRAITIGNSLPRILHGEAPAYAIRGLHDLALPGDEKSQQTVAAALEHAYCVEPREHVDPARDLLAQTSRATLDALEQLQTVAAAPYEPAATYPDTALGRALREVARLIKYGIGLEVAEVDYGGWDTHKSQGGATGSYANLVGGLAEATAAFARDLADKMDDVLLVTLSDFGRTAKENGTQGTDHGWANCMLALGGPVMKAGKGSARNVLGTWPGLGQDQLHDKRDLQNTTDFRDVLSEIIRVHLGNPNLETVLPQHQFQPVGLVG